jgi:hypothetical protein
MTSSKQDMGVAAPQPGHSQSGAAISGASPAEPSVPNAPWWRCIHCGCDEYEEHVFTGQMKGVPMVHCANCEILHSHPDPNSPQALRWHISELHSSLDYLLQAAEIVNSGEHVYVDPHAIADAKAALALNLSAFVPASAIPSRQGRDAKQGSAGTEGSAVPPQAGDAQ